MVDVERCACYETGPIRPPSEAQSLLVRVTRNCPWNRCTFCPVYKGQRFSLRRVDEIKADLRAMAEAARSISELSWRVGSGGAITEQVLGALLQQSGGRDALQIALFLRAGGEAAFLQDANSVILPVDRLVEVLLELRRLFPTVRRVTSYARAHTLCKRSVDELRRLRGAGLDRIHVGLESGADRVLALVEKGASAAKQIDAGCRVKAAGIELSEYVMPGLGGRQLSAEHARETARVLRAIDPQFIRLRSLAIAPGSALAEQCARGELEPLDDVAVVREILQLLEGLQGMTGRVVSDHSLNLLEEVEGQLPDELPRMQGVVRRFLGLPADDQELFIVGRRLGLLRRLDDLEQPGVRAGLHQAREQLQRRFAGPLEQTIREVMTRLV